MHGVEFVKSGHVIGGSAGCGVLGRARVPRRKMVRHPGTVAGNQLAGRGKITADRAPQDELWPGDQPPSTKVLEAGRQCSRGRFS